MNKHDNIGMCFFDTKRVWGDYYQCTVDHQTIMRSVRIFEGAMNSVHRHDTAEIMVVVSGKIEFTFGESPEKLEKAVLSEGQFISIAPKLWHRIRFIDGHQSSSGVRFAQLFELMTGDHQGEQYKIERLEPAKAGGRPKR